MEERHTCEVSTRCEQTERLVNTCFPGFRPLVQVKFSTDALHEGFTFPIPYCLPRCFVRLATYTQHLDLCFESHNGKSLGIAFTRAGARMAGRYRVVAGEGVTCQGGIDPESPLVEVFSCNTVLQVSQVSFSSRRVQHADRGQRTFPRSKKHVTRKPACCQLTREVDPLSLMSSSKRQSVHVRTYKDSVLSDKARCAFTLSCLRVDLSAHPASAAEASITTTWNYLFHLHIDC